MTWSPWHPVRSAGRYAPIPKGSGVYVIRRRRTGVVVYVGMSATGRLRKTCLRHFQEWAADWTHPEGRIVYDPDKHDVRWQLVTQGRRTLLRDAVLHAEGVAMVEFQPVDNLVIAVAAEADDEAPF